MGDYCRIVVTVPGKPEIVNRWVSDFGFYVNRHGPVMGTVELCLDEGCFDNNNDPEGPRWPTDHEYVGYHSAGDHYSAAVFACANGRLLWRDTDPEHNRFCVRIEFDDRGNAYLSSHTIADLTDFNDVRTRAQVALAKSL